MKRLLSRYGWMAVTLIASATHSAQFKFSNQTFSVPAGFEVEVVATTDLVQRPVSGSFDEQGRLYVTDSSGSNEKPDKQLANPNHRVLRLEDTDGDGKFDKSTVFADKMMFPEGCLWYDGSVYVAAPPSIWKLTDTNNDGVADVRVEWHQGKTLTGCANDLHGPFLGPDGWIYWCKGAFAEQTYEVNGKPFKSRASHIFRARPDHSRLEPVIAAGNDNPVGIAWTTTGERILCGTFFAPHEPGHRDGMVHAVYGGVFGKPNDALEGHKRTGDLMPVMTYMGAAAPCAVIRYQSGIFGEEYRDNLFCCQFNLHKVSRHILSSVKPFEGDATFKTKDSDFLVSDNTDFHPTDVIEDADGSLLVLDTGAWYKLCCPTSQLAKPEVLGAIYRIRRIGSPQIPDPRGKSIAWERATPPELAELLTLQKPAVVERAVQELAKRGAESIPTLADILKTSKNMDSRLYAVWALTRIDHPNARQAVHIALPKNPSDPYPYDTEAQQAALYSIGLWRDKDTINPRTMRNSDSWTEYPLSYDWGRLNVFAQRLAVEALGRIDADTKYKVRRLLQVPYQSPHHRILEHSLIYSLIEINNPEATRAGLTNFMSQRISLIALDQMDAGSLRPEEVLPFLKSPEAELRATAAWVAGHHQDWGGVLAGFFRERLATSELKESDRVELEKQLTQFVGSEPMQQLFAESLNSATATSATRLMLLRLMAQPSLKESPLGWADAVRAALDARDDQIVRTAITAARALGQVKTNAPNFADRLQRIARDPARPHDLRLDALAALPRGLGSVEPDLLSFLCANLDATKSVAMRSAAASVLAKAKLNDEALLTLANTIRTAGPLEVIKLLAAFEQATSEAVGLKLMAALKESKGFSGVNPGALKTLIAKYPPSVQAQGNELLALLNVDEAKQKARLDELLATLPKGDVRGGQAVFNGQKAACSSCHKIGYVGGTVGPDLTSISQARTERDLLEAIVYPSASFVRSYEPVIVLTKSDEEFSGVLRKDAADEIMLATGPNTEVRVARADITEMRPGQVSVMPGGLDEQLSRQELADLVAFLKGTKWGPN